MSANVFSVLLKYQIPKKRRRKVNPIERIIPVTYILLWPPKMHHRKPSITPTIGFNEYNNLNLSDMLLLLKPTGEIYIPNCTTKGTIYLKSRYLTLSAATYRPAPIEVRNAKKRNKGRKTICQEGTKWNQIINPIRIANEIRKSTTLTMTVLAGMIRRGKYIFVNIFVLVIRELLASLNEVEKNCQGSIAAYTSI
jgi:hypothetical protein